MNLRRWWVQRVARWYYLRGEAHRHLGNARGDVWEHWAAVEDFTRALVLDPTLTQIYVDRGILYWRELGEPQKALCDFNAVLEAHPPGAAYPADTPYPQDTPYRDAALFNRGIAYQQLGDDAAALADFRAYLEVGTHSHWREYAQRMLVELANEPDEEGQ